LPPRSSSSSFLLDRLLDTCGVTLYKSTRPATLFLAIHPSLPRVEAFAADAAAGTAVAPVGEKEQRDTETEEPSGATRDETSERPAAGDRWKQEEWRWRRA
jgi:hypothetical protein